MARSAQALALRNMRRRKSATNTAAAAQKSYAARQASTKYTSALAQLGRSPSPPTVDPEALPSSSEHPHSFEYDHAPVEVEEVEADTGPDQWEDDNAEPDVVFSNRTEKYYSAWQAALPSLMESYKLYTNEEAPANPFARSCHFRGCKREHASVVCVYLECQPRQHA